MLEELNFVNALIGIGSIIIVYLAWKSTNVQEHQRYTQILVIENNRRRLLENIVSPQITINQNLSGESNNSDTERRNSLNNLISPPAPSLQEVIDEVNDLAGSRSSSSNFLENPSEETVDEQILEEDSDSGPQQIIDDMDNPDTAEGLRRRRLEFYNRPQTDDANNSTGQPLRRENLNLQTDTENCSNENNENENISKNEENRNENISVESSARPPSQSEENSNNKEFRVKLKYLNDELRIVKSSGPNETIGDFKKRHFTMELMSEKLVRLVFNGHILQPDSKTLQACGLFDNCVVHCLIHKKPSNTTAQDANRNENSGGVHNNHPELATNSIGVTNTFLDSNTNGPIFVYFGIAMVSLAIVFCWYCRIQYSSLFSLYSTIGLVLMTALFLIIFPLVVLIERDVPT